MRSERRVGRVLEACGATLVAHGAMLGAGGDADHLVAGPGLVVVETKTGRGQVTATEAGLRVRGRQMPGDPVAQALRQAEALGRLAGVRAAAVVCVTDMEQGPFIRRGVTVRSLRDLPRVVAGAPRVLSASGAARLAHALGQRRAPH
jgi:hypothetical protein